MDAQWISEAVDLVTSGVCDKLVKDNVTVYRVKNIVRIDIKVDQKC